MSNARRDPTGSEYNKMKAAQSGYPCSFCNRSFLSLQSLGGHQTAHRKEIEEMRQQHKALVESKKLNPDHSPTTIDLLDQCYEGEVSNLAPGQDETAEDSTLDLTLKL